MNVCVNTGFETKKEHKHTQTHYIIYAYNIYLRQTFHMSNNKSYSHIFPIESWDYAKLIGLPSKNIRYKRSTNGAALDTHNTGKMHHIHYRVCCVFVCFIFQFILKFVSLFFYYSIHFDLRFYSVFWKWIALWSGCCCCFHSTLFWRHQPSLMQTHKTRHVFLIHGVVRWSRLLAAFTHQTAFLQNSNIPQCCWLTAFPKSKKPSFLYTFRACSLSVCVCMCVCDCRQRKRHLVVWNACISSEILDVRCRRL